MAYYELDVQRVRDILADKGVDFSEKKMFSGVCFMVDDKMCLGCHIDGKTGESLLMCRIGEEAYEEALKMEGCIPMEFTGKPMKGYVFVAPSGHHDFESLLYWVQLCLDFNPQAKSSKKKKK